MPSWSSAIGTLEKARFHRIKHTQKKPQDEIFEIDGPFELASIDGIVADGEPHFHMTFQDLDRAYAAHLEDGSIVCYLAEIVLAELPERRAGPSAQRKRHSPVAGKEAAVAIGWGAPSIRACSGRGFSVCRFGTSPHRGDVRGYHPSAIGFPLFDFIPHPSSVPSAVV